MQGNRVVFRARHAVLPVRERRRFVAAWPRLRRSTLARNTAWSLLSLVGRLVVQVGYFVLIARALGVAGFGTLAAALAVVFVLVPFAGWGAGNLLVMRVARDPARFPVCWGNALLTVLLTSPPLTLLVAAVGVWLLPALPLRLLLLLAVAEFCFGRLADLSTQAFQALERMRPAAALGLLPNTARCATALLFVALAGSPTPTAWAGWYLGSTVATAAVSLAVATACLGRPRFAPAALRSDAGAGGLFAVSLAADTIYADVDKMMLSRLATNEAAGLYAAAYRAVNMAFVPLQALFYATYARFFRHGARGVGSSLGFAVRLLPGAVAYAAVAGAGLFATAPLLPLVLGEEYRSSVDALRWLAPLPILASLQYLAADTLTGAGRQGARSAMQVAVAVANVGLNLWLLPRYAWRGAAWSTLACAAALAGGLWLLVWLSARTRPEVSSP